MKCDWQSFQNLVPFRMRAQIDQLGQDSLQELRMRMDQPPELVLKNCVMRLDDTVCRDDLSFCVNAASKYSPWTAASSAHGFITAAGGHRLGICGQAVVHDGKMCGISQVTSICIRVARDFPGIGDRIPLKGSMLIIGRPGSGKTTLLRDLIRRRAKQGTGSVAVVDERGELFPYAQGKPCYIDGNQIDVMTGCSKAQGIEAVLRTMGPECIAVDEITAQEDAQALVHAAWSGVDLYATAHAASMDELYMRPVYQTIVSKKLFQTLVIMQQDKTWKYERMDV